jgi:cobalt-zinc-cadmium efflux system outer membrane protein
MTLKYLIVFIMFLNVHINLLFADSLNVKLSLQDLINEALKDNPELQAVQYDWESEKAKVPQAGALPDPQLGLNLINIPIKTFDFDQEPMTGKQISLMQMFPFPGKLGLQKDIAELGVEISQARYFEFCNQLRKDIIQIYYDIFLTDKSIETTQRNRELVHQFTRVAETKYTVGKGLQQDVLKAQVELSKMEDKLITLKQRRAAFIARMNALLNRIPGSHFGKTMEPTADSVFFSLDSLKVLADENRPLFRAWQAMLQQSDKRVKLAKKSYLPDFSLGVAYTQREQLQSGMGGVDFVSGMFSMNLPVYFWKKQDKKVEETRYSEKMVQEKFASVRNQVYSNLDKTLSDVRKNYRLVDLYKNGIIPQAIQSLNSAVSGYQTDKVDFLTLLNNQMTLFDFELVYYQVLSDYVKGIAELEAQTGTTFMNK